MSGGGRSSFTSFAGLFGGLGQNPADKTSSSNCRRRESVMDYENVFQDPDWYMEQDASPSSDVPTSQATFRHRGSFSAIAGMSPCLGVPVESLYYNQLMSSKPSKVATTTSNPIATTKQRRRHFSLEDYHDDLLDDSSSSNESSFLQQQQQNVGRGNEGGNSRRGSNFQAEDDLSHIKSFMNDFCFGEEALFALDVEDSYISASLKSEFESRLLKAIEGSNPGLLVNFPEGLLRVIAGHVLQEAAEEPYGIKGCILLINFEGDTGLHHLGTLDCDPETPVKTFELTLTLRQGQTSWGQRMARRLSFTSTTSLVVSTSYKLVKKRKYRNDPEV